MRVEFIRHEILKQIRSGHPISPDIRLKNQKSIRKSVTLYTVAVGNERMIFNDVSLRQDRRCCSFSTLVEGLSIIVANIEYKFQWISWAQERPATVPVSCRSGRSWWAQSYVEMPPAKVACGCVYKARFEIWGECHQSSHLYKITSSKSSWIGSSANVSSICRDVCCIDEV